MNKLAIALTAVITSAAFSGCASKSYADGYSYGNDSKPSDVVGKASTQFGQVFTTVEGKTLYTFTKDKAGKSSCYDGCAGSWPPFYAQKDAQTWGKFTVIERNDGTYQWAWKDQPLYTWVGDQKKGDANGHGVGNVWYVASAK